MTTFADNLIDRVGPYKKIIWDWNGTLLDDVDMVVEINNILLRENGLSEITLQSYREQFRHPVREYYAEIGFDFEKKSFAEVGDRFIELYLERVETTSIFEEVRWSIEKMQKAGKKQSILSAGSQEHLDQIVPHFGVDIFFDHIFGIDNHYAAGKIGRGKELIEKIQSEKIEKSEIVMVGDTDHDVEVASHLGIHCITLTRGHQCRNRLHSVAIEIVEE